MKKYVTPEIKLDEFKLSDIIAATFTEGSDNETSWLDKWNSGIIKG